MALSIITDPVTKKQFAKDSAMPNSTYQPYVAPAVQPNPSGSLQGTMTQPQTSTPQTPNVPTAGGTPQQGAAVPTQPATSAAATAPMASGSFGALLGQIDQNLKTNNGLITQRQLLLKHLFDSPLTSHEAAQLPPDIQKLVGMHDKNAIELQVRILNDQLQGRANTLDTSVKYLTDAYTKDIEDAEKKKQDAINNVLNFAQTYGSQAGAALKSLYGDTYVAGLKDMGIDVDSFGGIQTLAEQKANQDGGGGSAEGYNGDFQATIDLIANQGGTNAQRAQMKNLMQSFIANGDYDSAYAMVQQSTGNGLKGAAATTFQQQTNSIGVLNDLKKAVQQYAAQGGNTNILKGTEDQIQTKIGKLMTDPKYASLAVQLNAAFQNYRLQMTGAAFGPKESAEYASILPSPGNTLDLNLAKLEGASNYLNSSVSSSIKSVVGPGGVYIKEYAEGATPGSGEAGGEITVKSPDGVVGTIPADQLQDALKQGYTKVE